MAKRRDTSQTVCCKLARGEEFLQDLQKGIVTVAAEINERRELPIEAAEKLKVAQVDAALQFETLHERKQILKRRR